MNTKKIISLILLALLLILVSCNSADKETDVKEPGSTEASSQTMAAETTTEPEFYTDGLEDFNFHGYTFRMLTGYETVGETKTLDTAEVNGDTINDAIYRRNREIEERFNCTLTEIGIKSIFQVGPTLKKSIQAGSDEYDIALTIDRDSFALVCSGNYFYPFNELPHINLDNPWWDQNARKMMSIGGKIYFTYGDESIPYFEYMCFLVFNKKMSQEFDLEDPYKLVADGKWTIDKMYEMARTVPKDLNNDGKYDDFDQVGIVEMSNYYYSSFWISDNNLYLVKGENDLPVFNVPGNEKMFSMMEKLFNYAGEDPVTFSVFREPAKNYKGIGGIDICNKIFSNGQALFENSSINMFTLLRGAELEIGILPYPKLEDVAPGTQYGARITGAMPIVVPVTNPNPERTSVLIESMSCGSKNYIIPAYYDIVLMRKNVRDLESEKMLDMMYHNRYIDLGDTLFMTDVRDQYTAVFDKNVNTFVSTTEKITPAVEAAINKAVEQYGQIK